MRFRKYPRAFCGERAGTYDAAGCGSAVRKLIVSFMGYFVTVSISAAVCCCEPETPFTVTL